MTDPLPINRQSIADRYPKRAFVNVGVCANCRHLTVQHLEYVDEMPDGITIPCANCERDFDRHGEWQTYEVKPPFVPIDPAELNNARQS